MEDEVLVEAVKKKRNIVYDVASISYRNNDKKECAWREIAEEVTRDGKHFPLLQYVDECT